MYYNVIKWLELSPFYCFILSFWMLLSVIVNLNFFTFFTLLLIIYVYQLPNMKKEGEIMKTWISCKLKYNLLFRRNLLNLLLLFFSPRNKFMIILSQNLDKHIVLYQKELAHMYKKRKNLKSINDLAA
jgi:hypothetical protein